MISQISNFLFLHFEIGAEWVGETEKRSTYILAGY